MATYDYKCENCGKVREEVHGMTEEPEILCKDHKEPVIMQRLISFNRNQMSSQWMNDWWDTKWRHGK